MGLIWVENSGNMAMHVRTLLINLLIEWTWSLRWCPVHILCLLVGPSPASPPRAGWLQELMEFAWAAPPLAHRWWRYFSFRSPGWVFRPYEGLVLFSFAFKGWRGEKKTASRKKENNSSSSRSQILAWEPDSVWERAVSDHCMPEEQEFAACRKATELRPYLKE